MAIIPRSQQTNIGQYGRCGIGNIDINDPSKWAEIAKDAADKACSCADKACECASKAEDAADKAEDTLNKINEIDIDGLIDSVDKANEAALESKHWAVGINPPLDHDTASDTNNSMFYSDKAKFSETVVKGVLEDVRDLRDEVEADKNHVDDAVIEANDAVNKAKDEVNNAKAEVVKAEGEVSKAKDEVAKAKEEVVKAAAESKLAHDFAVGPNPPTSLDTPTDTNNAYYYYQQVLNLTAGAIAFNGIFTPSASKEYPDKTATSSLWIIQTTDANGYTMTTGNMSGVTTMTGDWFLYYKDADVYEILKVSPLREGDVPLATEDKAGIAKLSTTALVDAGTDNSTIMTPEKVEYRLGKLTAADVGALPDDTVIPDPTTFVPVTRKVNEKALDADITLSAADVKARPDTWMPSASDVGAKPDDWKPATSDIPAAPTNDQPAGFGGFRYEVVGTAPNQTLKLYTVNP